MYTFLMGLIKLLSTPTMQELEKYKLQKCMFISLYFFQN